MPRTDKSVAILTGMIIAALYVILLVGFTQDSYRWREFSMRRGAASRTDDVSRLPVAQDGSKQVCTSDLPLCATLFPDSGCYVELKSATAECRGRVLVCTPSYTIVRPCRAPASFAKAEDAL